ncbi:MAG: cytochrome c biogenesis protein CcdA [Chloroflexota bacterium]
MTAILALLGPFGMGLLNMSNPCVLPLYPGFLAYLAGNSHAMENKRVVRWLGLIVLAGVLTSMLAIGFIIALLQVAIGGVLAVILPVTYLILIGIGIMMVANMNPFARIPIVHSGHHQNPLIGSFLYGLLYGPITLPCSGPLIVGVFVYGTGDIHSILDSILYVLAFGLGFGLPLLILPLLASTKQKTLLQGLSRHHKTLMRIGGVLLIVIGIVNFMNQGELIRHYWKF